MDIRINELDLTRSGIISVHRDLPATDTSWEAEYTLGEAMYRVMGSAFHGRPHGRDADVLLALQTVFFRAGCPDSNAIELTAAQLLALSGHARNGKNYAFLRASLLRLSSVKWTMVRTQFDEKKGRHQGETTTTGIIAEMQVTDQATGSQRPFEGRELTETSPIRISFVPSFAASIRDGFFQILDGELMSRLGQPQARSLYRVLQAHRVTSGGSLAGELVYKLSDWFGACGLEGERIDNAKRTLDQAHERLKTEGYLHTVEYQGRGRAGKITYTFSAAPEPELVDQLMERGVTRPVAETLAADHPQRVVPALKMVDERLGSGWKPRSLAASVVDAVRNPAKWGYVEPGVPVSSVPARKSRKAVVVEEETRDPRETIRILLRLKLGRAPTEEASRVLQELDEEAVGAVREAVGRPKDEALKLVRALLNVDL